MTAMMAMPRATPKNPIAGVRKDPDLWSFLLFTNHSVQKTLIPAKRRRPPHRASMTPMVMLAPLDWPS